MNTCDQAVLDRGGHDTCTRRVGMLARGPTRQVPATAILFIPAQHLRLRFGGAARVKVVGAEYIRRLLDAHVLGDDVVDC